MARALTRWLPLTALCVALGAASIGEADSVAPPPPLEVRCGGVTHVGVGERLALSVLNYRDGWSTLRAGVTYAVEPADVAEVSADRFLLGKRAGRAQVTATVPGVGTSLPRTFWVVEGLAGGTLPQLEGLAETKEWRLDWLVGPDFGPGLLLSWEGRTHALGASAARLPPGPPPWSIALDPEQVRYGPFDPRRSARDTIPAPRAATLTVSAWSAGVARGRLDVEQADGKRLSVGFRAALPTPLHPALVERLIETQDGSLSVGGVPTRTVRARPRGPLPGRRLLLVPPATGLDEAVRKQAQCLAGAGYDVLAVDLYDGATAPDPLSLAEGHVARDGQAGKARSAVARAMDPQRIRAVLLRALADEPPGPGAARRERPLGILAWGEACGHAAALLAVHSGVAALVLVDPVPDDAGPLSGSATTPLCVVLGTQGSPAARDLAAALLGSAPPTTSGLEVIAVPTAEPGVADPRWPLGYGPEPTQAAHARILAFLERHLR